jgi:regulator of replication initiation timing
MSMTSKNIEFPSAPLPPLPTAQESEVVKEPSPLFEDPPPPFEEESLLNENFDWLNGRQVEVERKIAKMGLELEALASEVCELKKENEKLKKQLEEQKTEKEDKSTEFEAEKEKNFVGVNEHLQLVDTTREIRAQISFLTLQLSKVVKQVCGCSLTFFFQDKF